MTSIFIAICLVAASVGAASAADQDGRKANGHLDGSYVTVVGRVFAPASGSCVLYSTLVFDWTTGKQVEAGLVHCSAATIDGTCTDGHTFVETYNGVYNCYQGYTFANGSSYGADVYRNALGSNTVTGSINGVSAGQTGFGTADNIQPFAWGEATGGSTCPVSPSGSFLEWDQYNIIDGWSVVTQSTVYQAQGGIPQTLLEHDYFDQFVGGIQCQQVGSLRKQS